MLETFVSRRKILGSAAAFSGLAVLSPVSALLAAEGADVTGRLARHLEAARDRALPEGVSTACKQRILTTFGAMVSGARMPAGEGAAKYVGGLGGVEQASVIGTPRMAVCHGPRSRQ
jgi:hypothetical protein